MTQEKTAAKDFLGIRTKREALGMTLKDVYSVTRISVVNLEAIENGDFQNLPAPTYTKNFIKIYAQTLGMDSKPVLDGYEAYLSSLPAPAQKKQEKETVHEEEVAPEQEPLRKGKEGSRYKAYIAVVVILIIAAVAGIAVFQQQHKPLPTLTGSQPSIAPTVAQVPTPAGTPTTPPATQPVAPGANLPVQSAQTTQTNAVQPVATEVKKQVSAQPMLPQQKDTALVRSAPAQAVSSIEKKEPALTGEGADVLVIKATEETWLRITIDHSPPFQVLLKPGEVIKRKGAAFGMDIGNAGGVKVQFKGKVIENIGKSGEVVHLQLP